jgi:hypothetical protein
VLGLNNSLVAMAGLMMITGVGFATVFAVRAGIDYMGARGNPRGRAQAHESLVDIIKGAVIVLGAVVGTALFYNTIKFG